jgi:glycosyltransferase involved in cell wall biosynthesis
MQRVQGKHPELLMSQVRPRERIDVSFVQGKDAAPSPRPRTVVFVETAAAMGGVEWSTLYLARHLDRARWHPLVVCPEEGDLPAACRSSGVEVHVLPRPAFLSTSIRLGSKLRVPNPLACGWDVGVALLAARRLRRLLAEACSDLVVTKGMFPHFYGGLAARWAGIPCIWHAQDLISERGWGLFRRCFGQLARWLPTRIVADGSPIVHQLPRSLQGKVPVVFNGVDTRVFRPGLDGAAVRRELAIPADACLVGHVARLTPWKGQHFLLESFARVAPSYPQARLLFVGSPVFDNDAYERRLRERTAALGLVDRVVFAGYRHDLPQVLAAMDVFAYPSVEKDTAPLSLASAMAAGLPIVAFDIEGVREAVGGERNAALVPVERVDALAGALGEVLGDAELRRRLSRGARRRAEGALSLDRFVSSFEEIFLDVGRGQGCSGSPLAHEPGSLFPAAKYSDARGDRQR